MIGLGLGLSLGMAGRGGGVDPKSLAIQGVGDSISQNTYQPKLAALLGRPVRSIASGGMTSTQIAARFGAVAIAVSLTGGQIPASGSVLLTACVPVPINLNSNPQTMPCNLAGVAGTLTRTSGGSATNTYTFTRAVAGDPVSVADGSTLIPTDVDYGAINIFWPGYNGADAGRNVSQDIAALVAKCTGPYLVLSVLNGTNAIYSASPAKVINDASIVAYAGNYVDVRQYMVDHYNPAVAQDVSDYGNGGLTSRVPSSLRSDFIHPNQSGQWLTAEFLGRALIGRGWADDISPGLDQITTLAALQSGVAATGVLIGATPGSVVTTNIPGLALDNATRTFSGTPNLPAGGTIGNGWVETLDTASRSSSQSVTREISDPGMQIIQSNNGRLFIPDEGKVHSDYSGTTPSAVGDIVAVLDATLGSVSGPSQQTPAACPVLRLDASNKRYLEFDGVDDMLNFASQLYLGHAQHTTIACVAMIGSVGHVFGQDNSSGSARASIRFQSTRKPQGEYVLDNGSSASTQIGAADLDTNPHVLSATRGTANNRRRLIVDGTTVYEVTATDGTMIVNRAALGGLPGGTSKASMRLYGFAHVPVALSDTDRLIVENYMGGLAGLTIS